MNFKECHVENLDNEAEDYKSSRNVPQEGKASRYSPLLHTCKEVKVENEGETVKGFVRERRKRSIASHLRSSIAQFLP